MKCMNNFTLISFVLFLHKLQFLCFFISTHLSIFESLSWYPPCKPAYVFLEPPYLLSLFHIIHIKSGFLWIFFSFDTSMFPCVFPLSFTFHNSLLLDISFSQKGQTYSNSERPGSSRYYMLILGLKRVIPIHTIKLNSKLYKVLKTKTHQTYLQCYNYKASDKICIYSEILKFYSHISSNLPGLLILNFLS